MRRLTILLMAICIAFVAVNDVDAATKKKRRSRKAQRTKKVVKPKRMVVQEIVNDNGILCEDTCSHVHGIDMSHYQGNVFWDTLANNTETRYVYLKATEGGDRIDAAFERNIVMAHVYGLKVGSYHFYRPRTDQQKQLQNFVSQCIPEEQDLIPMIDIETTQGMGTDEFCDSLFRFLDMVEEVYHQKPLLYTFRNFYNRHLLGKLDGYKLMIAMYLPEEPVLDDNRDITMWQYTGKGRVEGVNGYVDKSRFMGNHVLREIRFRHH